jgi:hypothetical protein
MGYHPPIIDRLANEGMVLTEQVTGHTRQTILWPGKLPAGMFAMLPCVKMMNENFFSPGNDDLIGSGCYNANILDWHVQRLCGSEWSCALRGLSVTKKFPSIGPWSPI